MRFCLLIWMSVATFAQQTATPPPLVPVDQLKVPKTEEDLVTADQPQAGSLNGNALFGIKDKDGRIKVALQAILDRPKDPEAILNAGQIQDGYRRFFESIGTYSEGIEKFPKDFRFLRMRGHRYLSTRKFAQGIEDLQKAVAMAPNSFDAAYYLGLGYYFSGDHAKAAQEFERCEAQVKSPLKEKSDLLGSRSCETLEDDPNWLVPIQFWHYLALRRAGEMAAAKKYLDEKVSDKHTITSTKAFYEALLFFKGRKEINDMMVGANEGTRDFLTRSTAAATYLFTEGDRGKACSIWSRNAMDQNWDHLGVLASESEYWRNSRAACALYAAPKPTTPPQL
jgi:tetratricopeptide (TPR) repeat protein